ncbi:MAG TPA: GNAT family N-acetyltransferase [Chthoniobacterales bacterium]
MPFDDSPAPRGPIQLRDGRRARTRPIQPGDAGALTRGLERLSPTGNAYRFLHHRKRFTEAELHYLTHCDFHDHIAVVLALLDAQGHETDQVGVARCIRTPEDPELAEVGIVLVDDCQNLGGGTALLRHLVRLAWASGIRRWQAFSFAENVAASQLLRRFGLEISQRDAGYGTTESIYELLPPEADGTAD